MSKSKHIYGQRGLGTISGTGHRNIQKNHLKRGEHVWIVEAILGKTLPKGSHVHHVNNNPSDNRHENLVVCPDAAYHKLLHRRTDAFNSCGHADWNKCTHCKEYGPDVVPHMFRGKPRKWHHPKCEKNWWKQYRSAA